MIAGVIKTYSFKGRFCFDHRAVCFDICLIVGYITISAGLEIAGTKVQICTLKAAHCTQVCLKTLYKIIDRVQLFAELGQNCAWLSNP